MQQRKRYPLSCCNLLQQVEAVNADVIMPINATFNALSLLHDVLTSFALIGLIIAYLSTYITLSD
jgi:hypothetical protein